MTLASLRASAQMLHGSRPSKLPHIPHVRTAAAASAMNNVLGGASEGSCAADAECSCVTTFFGGCNDCLPRGCSCDYSSASCGKDTHCVSVKNAVTSEISTSVFFDTLDPSGPRYCFEYQPLF